MEQKTKITDMNLLGAFITDSISKGQEVNLTVTGDSMYPLLKSRVDTVVLTMPKTIKKRDIVFFRRENGSYILHRILKIKKDFFVIAGDNEMEKEFPVYKNQIIAVVKSFKRKGRAYSVEEPWFKFYSFVWCLLFPLRPFMLKTLIKLATLRNRRKLKWKKKTLKL